MVHNMQDLIFGLMQTSQAGENLIIRIYRSVLLIWILFNKIRREGIYKTLEKREKQYLGTIIEKRMKKWTKG